MPIKPTKPNRFKWPAIMLNVTYACVLLAVVLVVTEFWLYGIRYQRIFAQDTWSAITISNGQTYFGHLEQYGPHTLVLFNVYYLQANQSATEAAATEETSVDTTQGTDAESDPNLRLFKLTEDFHKPNDYLIINKDQILFWQHLSTDSPIVKTIIENSGN